MPEIHAQIWLNISIFENLTPAVPVFGPDRKSAHNDRTNEIWVYTTYSVAIFLDKQPRLCSTLPLKKQVLITTVGCKLEGVTHLFYQ